MTTNTNTMANREGGKGREAELIAALRSEASLREKMDACRELAVVGTQAAIPVLAELLCDEKLSHMARYALEPIPEGAVDDALLAALPKASGRTLVGIVASLGVRRSAKAVPALVALLGHSDPQAASAAARALGRIGTPEAAKALKEKLGSAPPPVRLSVADGCLACAESFARSGDKESSAALYAAVAKADLPEYVRAAAERAAAAR